jgi:phospholipid/cholesterol/gamma-HCH transport system substrate-binding protein
MEREANYVTVGAFVVLVLAMATVFVLWYTNAQDRRDYERYEIYFTGSVSGLNEGSTVRYLGVNVGRVRRIALDPRAGDRVMVLVDLASDTPIDDTTVARLTPQGVTGLLFIDLQQAGPNAMKNVTPPVPSLRFPVIRSLPSNLDVFLNGLPDLLAEVNRTIERLNEMLSTENVEAANAVLANVRAASDTLPALSRDAGRLVAELQATTAEARRVAAQANEVMATTGPEVAAAATRLRELSDRLVSTTGRIDALLEHSGPDLERFSGQGLAEVELLVRDSRAAITEVRDLARSLRERPSQLLYEQAPTGVEIPR